MPIHNMPMQRATRMMSDMTLKRGMDTGGDIPCHFRDVGVVLWSVYDEDGHVGGGAAAVGGGA